MSQAVEERNRRMLRARDAMDRSYAQPLDVPTQARIAHVSEARFIRTFAATFGETPHRYLQRRRVERPIRRVAVDDTWSALRFRPPKEGEATFTGGRTP